MLLATLVACGKDDGDGTGDGQGTVSTNDTVKYDQYGQQTYDDPTAGLNYNGKTVNFLVRSEDQYLREWTSPTGEPQTNVDWKIYERNVIVKDALGVTLNYIKQDEGADNKDFYDTVINTAMSGLGGIDVVSGFAAYATNPNALPYYVNWFDSEKLPYLNLDRAYWNQNYQRDAAAFGKLYVNVGDMNLSLYDRCMVVYFNKAKVESYIKDSSGKSINLYQLVQSGQWYYETFYGMIKDVYEDTGANQGKREFDDFYGVTGIKGSEASDAFLYSLGGQLSETASDGSHALVKKTKLEKLGEIYEAMTDFWYSTGAVLPKTSGENYDIFTGGHALFTVDVVWHYDSGLTALHNMTDGYGIIPMPKFDENQESYITGVQDAYNVLSIMECGEGQDFAMISAVLEKMALESYYGVRPYYIENILKLRNMDFESSECFNYVLDGICFDFVDVYCADIEHVREYLWRRPFQVNSSFETNWGNIGGKYNNLVKQFDTWLATQ